MKTLFFNGKIHTMVSEEDTADWMTVSDGKICETGKGTPAASCDSAVNLQGKHVYPCLIDAHTHLLLTVAVMATGFSACEIRSEGIVPNTVEGVGARIRAYAKKQKPGAVIAVNNYIMTAMDEHRMPTREELDRWTDGRAAVVYNIDGHSTSLSTKMLETVGISPEGHSGILQGEENERTQGRLIDAVGKAVTLPVLAKGIAAFQNYCADHGIGTVAALEGNGDSPKDSTTGLIIHLARHFDVGVRLYLQYTDPARVAPYAGYMKHLRVGGCGDWEMDGSVGSHSAAFRLPFSDTGETAPCYFSQEEADAAVRIFAEKGYQIASHAIGELAIERLLTALNRSGSTAFHRVEHCEFCSEASLEELKKGNFAAVMQPGYAWIDKRYLHTYEAHLPESIRNGMKLKSLYDAGVCVCGSSDSPVQDMDPFLQMLGMTCFYRPEESLTPYEAMCTYTKNAARALLEEDERGTLEPGKAADFFTAEEDFFRLAPEKTVEFRPVETYYGGKPAKRKKGTVAELAGMLLKKPRKI